MFINVRYGNDELLLCNPQCIVNNLLENIKLRCCLANSGKILDLSDETGLVLGLNDHKDEYSDFYLLHFSTYILVEKQLADPVINENTSSPNYVPLLKDCSTLLPEFKIRVSVDSLLVDLNQSHKVPRLKKSANKSQNKKTKRGKTKSPRDPSVKTASLL